MAWEIKFDESAKKELKRIDRKSADRLVSFLRDRVSVSKNPRVLGTALKGSRLGEFWKYRVGDYRLIVKIQDNIFIIVVLRVGHRREVYR